MKRAMRQRWTIFLCGMLFSALGISMITKAGLGTSPLTALPLVLSRLTGQSLGTFVFLTNVSMFLGEMLLEEKGFVRTHWVQIPATLVFSALIDLTFFIVSFIVTETYLAQCIVLVCGTVFLGTGVGMQVMASIMLLPGEGLVSSIAKKFSIPFGKVKTGFDLTLVLLAVIISLLSMHTIYGIREGTLVAASLVGAISQLFRRYIRLGGAAN